MITCYHSLELLIQWRQVRWADLVAPCYSVPFIGGQAEMLHMQSEGLACWVFVQLCLEP